MPAGNERKIKSAQELYDNATAYVDICKKKREYPNIAGFCAFLGMHRETYYRYKEEFYKDTVKKIEDIFEDRAINADAKVSDAMKIFYLKNKFGYKDKQDIALDASIKSQKLEDFFKS